jgi:hypothetical protein
MFDQIALAAAVAQMTGEYLRSRNGISIVKDNNASVIELWNGIRFEVISELWKNCKAHLEKTAKTGSSTFNSLAAVSKMKNSPRKED